MTWEKYVDNEMKGQLNIESSLETLDSTSIFLDISMQAARLLIIVPTDSSLDLEYRPCPSWLWACFADEVAVISSDEFTKSSVFSSTCIALDLVKLLVYSNFLYLQYK